VFGALDCCCPVVFFQSQLCGIGRQSCRAAVMTDQHLLLLLLEAFQRFRGLFFSFVVFCSWSLNGRCLGLAKGLNLVVIIEFQSQSFGLFGFG
jgi:hypothetical protein